MQVARVCFSAHITTYAQVVADMKTIMGVTLHSLHSSGGALEFLTQMFFSIHTHTMSHGIWNNAPNILSNRPLAFRIGIRCVERTRI